MEDENPQLAPEPVTETLPPIPNHVSSDRTSEHWFPFNYKIDVKINGVLRKKDVLEFNVSEGWARIQLLDRKGRPRTERGKFVSMIIRGKIEPFYRD